MRWITPTRAWFSGPLGPANLQARNCAKHCQESGLASTSNIQNTTATKPPVNAGDCYGALGATVEAWPKRSHQATHAASAHTSRSGNNRNCKCERTHCRHRVLRCQKGREDSRLAPCGNRFLHCRRHAPAEAIISHQKPSGAIRTCLAHADRAASTVNPMKPPCLAIESAEEDVLAIRRPLYKGKLRLDLQTKQLHNSTGTFNTTAKRNQESQVRPSEDQNTAMQRLGLPSPTA